MRYLLLIVLVTSGCQNVQDDASGRYLVVSKERYMRKYPAFDEEKEEIRFTLKHGTTRIVAHCQEWDIENKCGQLEVGKEYEMKRDKQGLDFISSNEKDVTLAVEKETLEP